ncbi:Holliday junction resolvase RecU [Liquorilactobacillus nagelii]|uniref:Holliday junction resolvase RecU n=1 Tax=Liquorilactobacillus nagelii TaxID=82688 RepID=UPI001CCA77EA|nr:Holliday junction resolvase RecU [Liquorilactobacillus nagelii]ULQ50070.1 Holliday junction resolvase RecU [Liquorilactobacillus nagelii]
MVIRYPNGQSYRPPTNLKYENNSHSAKNEQIIFGNRGMSLEDELNTTNQYYLDHHQAVIHKKPVPIQIVQVDYPRRSAAVIKEAYFKQASTTDYNGVYQGYYLDFEAKETRNHTSFPLSNFHPHQIKHMQACTQQGGICFTIIKFSSTQELFLLPAAILFSYWEKQTTNRKSIPKKVISSQGFSIKYGYQPLIPYLTKVDLLIEQLK